MNLQLEGKTAWISRGSRGIGKAIAMELAREGADIAISDRTETELEITAAEIRDRTGRRVTYACSGTGHSVYR